MKRIIFLCLSLIVSVTGVSGQKQNIDSLLNVLNTQKLTVDEELSGYKKLCNVYRYSDPQKLIKYAKKVLELAIENKKDNYTIATSYYFIGIAYHTKADLDSASMYYQKALNFALETDDKQTEISAYIGFGFIYCDRNDYIKGIEYYMKALSIAESTNNIPQQIHILANIGSTYRRFDNNTHALQYFEKVEKLAEQSNSQDGRCMAYFNIGCIYQDQGNMHKALEYELKALEISRSIGHTSIEIGSLLSIAQVYYSEEFKEYEKAEKYATEGLLIAEKLGDPQILKQSYAILANIYARQKRYAECDIAATKAWETDTTNIVMGRDFIFSIVHANIFLGNKDKAAEYLDKLFEIVKKVNDKNLHESLSEMEVKYETEKKEMQIATLEKERQMYASLGVAGVLLIVALVIVLLQNKRNARKERQLIAARSVLDGEMRERSRLAQDLHDRLSGNLSAVKIELAAQAESLQGIRDKLDNCIRDIREAAHDLMPASLQFGMKVALEDYAARFPDVKFHFYGDDKRIEERLEFVVYCCASELVNNAVKHSGAKNINLQLVQDEKHVALTVSDDGCGYDEKAAVKGFGLKSIRDRVASCNGKMDVATAPGKGTETTIEIAF